MIIAFGFEKLDNGQVKIHTLAWSNVGQKMAQLACHPAKISRVVQIGFATDKQKEMFLHGEDQELQTRVPVAKKTWGRGRFPRASKSTKAVRQEEDRSDW